MEHTDEDPALAILEEKRHQRLTKLVMNGLTEAAKDFMRVAPQYRHTGRLTLTSSTPAPRTSLGRKTKPIPIIKMVWHVGGVLTETADPMMIYVATDGVPYVALPYQPELGERRVELTEELLEELSDEMLENMRTVIQEKRSTLELLRPVI